MRIRAIDIIRLIGGEFSEIPTEKLEMWIEICRPMVSRKQFGKLYEQALALMVCHKLKMGGEGTNPLGDLGKIGVGFSLGSVSEGGSSLSFGAGQSSNLAEDAELGLTVYGLQYLSLRRMVVVPIHVSGEQDLTDVPVKRRRRPGITNPEGGGSGEEPGKEPGEDPENPAAEIPIATDTTLGGVRVKPGSGLLLEEGGTLSVDVEGIVADNAEGG